MDKIIENNQAEVCGTIESDFVFSHEVFGEGFYVTHVSVKRDSGICDIIPVTVSERLIDVNQDYTGEMVCITGQFRSYNKHEEERSHLVLYVFAREITFVGYEYDETRSNQIFLDGFICKNPTYRKTPLGREVTDLLLAVNRPYGKADYIPCICWGRNARFASGFNVGEHLRAIGRIQSREYIKKATDEEFETRIAYEVSISKMEVIG